MGSSTASSPEGPEPTRLAWRAAVLVSLAPLVAAAVIWLPVLEPVRDRFTNTDARWVSAAFVLQAASFLSFVAAFRGAFERRLSWRAAVDLAAVEAGANVILPSGGSGGLALGAVLLIRAGVPTHFTASRTAVLFLVTSAASFVALVLAGAGEAVGLLAGSASLGATLGPAAAGVLVVAAAVALARWVPSVHARPGQRVRGLLRRLQLFLRDSVELSLRMIRSGDLLLLGGSFGYFAFDVASLAAAFHALDGAALPLGTFVLAYVLGHGGALLPVPGSAEGGLVGMFAAYGSPLSLTVSAILVYRTFHAGLPTVLGLLAYLDIRRMRRDAPSRDEIERRFA